MLSVGVVSIKISRAHVKQPKVFSKAMIMIDDYYYSCIINIIIIIIHYYCKIIVSTTKSLIGI